MFILHLTPNVSISDFTFKTDVDLKSNKAIISFRSVVDNKEFKKTNDTLGTQSNFTLRTQIFLSGWKDKFKFRFKYRL